MQKTHKGSASFVMVMFFTILVGILTVGFISIMLNNMLQSTNYDLSESAYDSAMVGLEDAKVMLIKYYNCVLRGGSNSGTGAVNQECQSLTSILDSDAYKDDCNVVGKALKRDVKDGEETPIKTVYENSGHGTSATNNTANMLDQAYTCVKVQTQVDDFIGTLTPMNDSKIVPIRTNLYSNATTPSEVGYVQISWFNNEDLKKAQATGYGDESQVLKVKSNLLAASGSSLTVSDMDSKRYGTANTTSNLSLNKFIEQDFLPTTLQIGLIQVPITSYRLSDLKDNYGAATNRGQLTLQPVLVADNDAMYTNPRIIDNKQVGSTYTGFAGSAIAGSFKDLSGNTEVKVPQNSPYQVKCSVEALSEREYACVAKIKLPKAIGRDASNHDTPISTSAADISRFIMVSMPYNDIATTYNIKLFKEDGVTIIPFAGVQTKVDSTGRANDLFRRIEARVEVQDTLFPIPANALGVYCTDSTNCGNEGKVKKSSWVSYNCFTMDAGVAHGCDGSNSFPNYINASAGFDVTF